MQLLGDRVLVIAFEGWNDAAEAATSAVDAMKADGDYVLAHTVDPESYFDFQYTRPSVHRDDDGVRRLTWPGATLWSPRHGSGLWLLRGQEPARRWKRFASEFVATARDEGITGVILLGSMMGDVPHTRPILVHSWSENEYIRANSTIERGRYEGPVGMLSVMADALETAGIPTMSQWASVPHYLSMQAKAPKATIALLDKVADLTGITTSHDELDSEARKWEASIDAAMNDDAEMVEYIRSLEQARDAWDTPAAKGDAIAREFEQFLRRDNEGPRKGPASGPGDPA